MRRIPPLVLVLALVLGGVAASCTTGGSGNELTIYSGRSEDLVQPLITQFEEETGIDVTVRYADSADLAATLVEEGDGSPADVFFAQDPASLGTVALEGLFGPIPSDLMERVAPRFSDPEARWVGVSGRSRVVVYDSERLDPADLPQTEDGFADPSWAGRVAIAPTNGSFLAFVSAKILLEGEDATRAWLEAMKANQSPTFANNASIVTAVNDGQVETGLVNHYYLLRALDEDPSATGRNWFFPSPSAGSLVMPAGVGILGSTDHTDEAERFVDFLLGEAAQSFFATETFEYPLVSGIEADDQLPPLDSLVTPDLDLSLLATTLDLATDLVAEVGLL